jgi:hypothetical protein
LNTLLWRNKYSVILTKGAIFHKRYLEAYSSELPQEVRDMVAKRRNCEDIAMQFVVSSMTDDRPVFVWDPWCVWSSFSCLCRRLCVNAYSVCECCKLEAHF